MTQEDERRRSARACDGDARRRRRARRGVEIGPYAVIGPNVRIGAGTHIGPHVVIERDTRSGATAACTPAPCWAATRRT
jgi:UDP-3-O-[3-hydroxymyristoyl] glucosamine N-acyltransferase